MLLKRPTDRPKESNETVAQPSHGMHLTRAYKPPTLPPPPCSAFAEREEAISAPSGYSIIYVCSMYIHVKCMHSTRLACGKFMHIQNIIFSFFGIQRAVAAAAELQSRSACLDKGHVHPGRTERIPKWRAREGWREDDKGLISCDTQKEKRTKIFNFKVIRTVYLLGKSKFSVYPHFVDFQYVMDSTRSINIRQLLSTDRLWRQYYNDEFPILRRHQLSFVFNTAACESFSWGWGKKFHSH